MAGGETPKVLAAAPQEKRGRGRLAFGAFLFGIVIPFPLWIISVRAAEAGFMLSALLMLLALVLGLFSFREPLGKVTVVCSMLTLLVYGAFIALSARALHSLEQEHARKPAVFAALKPWLNGAATASQTETARTLDTSEGAVKVAIHRLRARFRELVRAEIATTVNDPADIADELRHLIAVAGSS